MRETVVIEAIGHRGDGIVTTPDGPLYVPFVLPGERVAIERSGQRGRVVEVLEPSAERVQPVCRHFGTCGGCALQMMPLGATRRLKREFVVAALAQRGLSPPVDETIGVRPASRRRVVLTALLAGERTLLGYHERLSHRLVDIEKCPVLEPQLAAALPNLRNLAASLLNSRRATRLTVLLTRGGLDVDAADGAVPPANRLPEIANLCTAAGVARLSVDSEPLLKLAEPVIEIAGVPLVPPPGAFVQASAEAEAAMTGLVAAHLSGAKSTADLFAGFGTFSLALAREMRVHAVESNEDAPAALMLATRQARGLKPITAERRDLFASPLTPTELDRFDAVVLDPPYAGAKAQAEALAQSRVGRIASVSRKSGDLCAGRADIGQRWLPPRTRRARRSIRLLGEGGGRGAVQPGLSDRVPSPLRGRG
ncbi:MAG: class I SAM-dependent RNA methyltransferase [Propylenella sp.]